MSNSHMFMRSGFPRAPLLNGIGRYIVQLKRITIKFCKSNGDSKGMREFIESDLIDYAKNNPGVVVYVKPRRHRTPILIAEYLNGNRDYINCHNYTREEVYKWINLLTTKSGREIDRYRKLWHTDNPSIQGVWTPFTFRDPTLNATSFPIADYNGPKCAEPSATDQLIDLFKKQQLEEKYSKGIDEKSTE